MAMPMPAMPPPYLEKPTAAFVLSLIGGILILVWGLFLVDIGQVAQRISFGFAGGGLTLIGLIETLCGVVILTFAALLFAKPEHHLEFGVLVLVFSLVSLVGFGGAVIGFILALVGGSSGSLTRRRRPRPP
ncbi:MAG: DUF6114 domain-containing protein [Candidatus Lutacidiplasmatales archaeon]